MKNIVSKVISAFILVSTVSILLTGCFSKGEHVVGKEGALLLLANERMRGEMLDKNDGIFRDAEEALVGMANQGREFLTAYEGIENDKEAFTARMASSSDLVTDIAAPGRSYTQFNETVLNSVTLAERGAENIRLMKERVRVLDTWVVFDDDSKMLLHVEENSELLLAQNEYYDFICYRTRLEDGTERYDLMQFARKEGYSTRAGYIKNRLYDCNMISMTDDGEYEYIGFVAQMVEDRWECLEYRYIPQNEIPYDYSYVIMNDDLCFKAYKFMSGEGEVGEVNNLVLSSDDRTVDIVTMDEREDITTYNIFVGAYEGYRGVLVGGKDEYDNNLVLGDGTVLENYIEAQEGEVGVKYIVKYETAWGTEFEMSFIVRGGSHDERNAAFAEYLEKIGIRYKDATTEELLDRMNRARELLSEVDRDFEWNGYPIGTHEGSRAAHAVEMELIDRFLGVIEEYKNSPEVNYLDIKNLDLASFAELENASFDFEIEGNAVRIASASATVTDLTLFTEGERYHLAFALMDEEGLVHINGYEKNEIALTSDILTLRAENIVLNLSGIAVGQYKLVMYASTSDGIRSTEAYVIGEVTVAE